MAHKKIDLDNWTPSDPSNPLKSLAIEVNNNFDALKTMIDAISTGGGGVGKGYAAAYVNAGTFVTLDNIKVSVTTGGQRGLCMAAVATPFNASISGTYGLCGGGNGGATSYPGPQYTTNVSGSFFGWSFANAGDASTYLINDYTNWRFYRVTMMIGPGYNNNFISIERMI